MLLFVAVHSKHIYPALLFAFHSKHIQVRFLMSSRKLSEANEKHTNKNTTSTIQPLTVDRQGNDAIE